MKLTVVGCGDAFGSGGRLQTCYHVATDNGAFLIDCGATALIGLKRLGIETNGIPTIFISHLHGDHFSGLVWWLIDALYVSKRTTPLVVTGPKGIEQRFLTAAEALFPRCTATPRRFELSFREYTEREPLTVGEVTVTAFEVSHPSGAPSYALRLSVGGKTLAFSGDTEWVENLLPTANGADLFIAECYGFDVDVRYHLNWKTLSANTDRLGAKRLLLTHMNESMLASRALVTDPRVVCAEDGMELDI